MNVSKNFQQKLNTKTKLFRILSLCYMLAVIATLHL